MRVRSVVPMRHLSALCSLVLLCGGMAAAQSTDSSAQISSATESVMVNAAVSGSMAMESSVINATVARSGGEHGELSEASEELNGAAATKPGSMPQNAHTGALPLSTSTSSAIFSGSMAPHSMTDAVRKIAKARRSQRSFTGGRSATQTLGTRSQVSGLDHRTQISAQNQNKNGAMREALQSASGGNSNVGYTKDFPDSTRSTALISPPDTGTESPLLWEPGLPTGLPDLQQTSFLTPTLHAGMRGKHGRGKQNAQAPAVSPGPDDTLNPQIGPDLNDTLNSPDLNPPALTPLLSLDQGVAPEP